MTGPLPAKIGLKDTQSFLEGLSPILSFDIDEILLLVSWLGVAFTGSQKQSTAIKRSMERELIWPKTSVRLLDIMPEELRCSFSGKNYRELPTFLRVGGKSRQTSLTHESKWISITYAVAVKPKHFSVMLKLHQMRSHWAQIKQREVIFCIYGFIVSCPWLKQ